MKFYLCSCDYCAWKGNKTHVDGQCPVCGNAIRIRLRRHRFSSDLSPKLKVSGLSTDDKLVSSKGVFSVFRRLKDISSVN